MVKTNKARNPNSRREATDYVLIRYERGDILVDKRVAVVPAQEDTFMRARFAVVWPVAVVNVGQYITFLEFHQGPGDTDGCDGDECCEELSGENHR